MRWTIPSIPSRRSSPKRASTAIFRRSGKLKLASKPKHFEAIARNFESLNKECDPDTALLSPEELRQEVGSPFYGAMLSKKSAMMHMGRYVAGLATAAARHGATIFEGTTVTEHRETNGIHALQTSRGSVTAANVVMATGAYTTQNFTWFRRRIIAVGSFLIATRPLTDTEVAAVMPATAPA